ncbi:hypothetical protein MLD38_024220 [Melastoma candidum]|uniref:Uncharacterized protein n=1 Tax=Melastoma candidum TaxID=119954 RepID=A0ACB9NYD3_9MYRT|nr:hypothetical protein MLD38_024220 [Melastoma candidum]
MLDKRMGGSRGGRCCCCCCCGESFLRWRRILSRSKDLADKMSSPHKSPPVHMMEGVEEDGGGLMTRAEAYQQYMKKIEVPKDRGSLIPFVTWATLGKSIEQLYGQPLHYLTNIALRQLDQKRLGSEDEYMPLDLVMHPCKAEAMIWLMEEVHRSTSSYLYIAELWRSDPFYQASLGVQSFQD